MWTNRNYDELMTFSEYVDQFGSETLYEGTEFEDDDVTTAALYEWFFYRKVVDNERFKRYFRRALDIYEHQYYQRLRLEFTDFDPMVTSYLERQILRAENRSGTSSRAGTDTTTGTRSGNNSTSGNGRSTTESTTEADSNGTTSGSSTDTGTTSGTSNTNTKNLHGETPSSAIGSSGMPSNLDWTYLSSQDENQANNTTSGTSNATGTTSGTATDHSESSGSSTTTTTDGSTGQFTETSGGSVSRNDTENRSENISGNDRERMTGRQEAPQDLLDRARDYITRTNAFMWLSDRLDNCFMQIFDM